MDTWMDSRILSVSSQKPPTDSQLSLSGQSLPKRHFSVQDLISLQASCFIFGEKILTK